jgi:hypothetical protein
MQDSATGRGSATIAARLLGGAAALLILAVPVAAAVAFAPRFTTAGATPVSIAAGDDLAAHGVRPAAEAAPAGPPEAKPAEESATVLLQNWEYTRKKPSINPPK